MSVPLQTQALLTAVALANLSRAIAEGLQDDLQLVGRVIGEHGAELRDAALEAVRV
jgi:hypothetical protein